jgi:hypothetical protein
MTTTSTPGSAARAASTTPPAPDGITRLHPYDGLFLRAEHLERLQSYTRALTWALGQAGGMGVVYGYGVRKDSKLTLSVDGGLAFLATGQPLRMITAASVKLNELTKANGAWVIELAASEERFGDDTVFGALCEDPCEGAGVSTQPYVAEQVRVQLHPFVVAKEETETANERRSRVARAWFKAERREAGALVVADSAHNPDGNGDFSTAAWRSPTGRPGFKLPSEPSERDTVPIGVLLRVGDDWEVDTWIARRDRIDTPPRRAWQGRLGMRPWDVFVAQVLQFQVHLAEVWPEAMALFASIGDRRLAINDLDKALETLDKRRMGGVIALLRGARDRLEGKLVPAAGEVGTLRDIGLVELPPAGFLPLPHGGGWADMSDEEKIKKLMGDSVELRFCACRPDAVAHAIDEAQHLDRIPLDSTTAKPKVDILVPTQSGSWGSARYGWIAFHRRRDLDCPVEEVEDPKDRVHVYVYPDKEPDDQVKRLLAGERENLPDTKWTVPYPVDGWALPPADLQDEIDQATAGLQSVRVVGLTKSGSEERTRLVWVRAVLLASRFAGAAPPLNLATVGAVATLPEHEEIHIIGQPVIP